MLGIPLKEFREEAGISQRALGEGICDRGMVRACEEGRGEPEKLLVDALVQRTGKTIDKYFIRLDDEEYELAKKRTWIQIWISRGKFLKAEYAIREYQNLPGSDNPLHRQFIAFVKAKLLLGQGATLNERVEAVRSGLAETVDMETFSIKILKKRVFHLLELFLLQQYAVLLEEMGQEAEAVCWYKALLERFGHEKRGTADQQKLYPLVAYQLAGYYLRQGKEHEALPLLQHALNLLRYSKIQNAMYVMLWEREMTVRENLGDKVLAQEKRRFLRLKEFLGKNSEVWRRNYDPVYLEPNLCSVNAMLLDRRTAQGKTRENLAGLVCDPRTLERQEKNGSKPQKRTWKGLFERLGLSYLKYDGGIVAGEYGDHQKHEDILQALDKNKTDQAWEKYDELIGKLDMGELTNRQFKKYWEAELSYQSGKISREERNAMLWEMLAWTMGQGSKEKHFSCWLTKHERKALVSLAWDCEGEEIDVLLPLMKKQLYRDFSIAGQMMTAGYYDELLYCIARGYFKKGNLLRAEQYITLAIQWRGIGFWGLSWDRLFFMRFRIERQELELWKKENSLESYKAAFQWLAFAWASAKENRDDAMCDFLKRYFKILYDRNRG